MHGEADARESGRLEWTLNDDDDDDDDMGNVLHHHHHHSSFSFIVCLVIVHASTGQTFSPPHKCLLAAAVANFALVMPFDQQLAQRVETLESSSMTSRHVCTQCFYRDTITVPPHSSFTTNGFKDEMGVLAFTP